MIATSVACVDFKEIRHGRNCGINPARWSRYQSYVNIIDTTYSVLDLFQVYHYVDGPRLGSSSFVACVDFMEMEHGLVYYDHLHLYYIYGFDIRIYFYLFP